MAALGPAATIGFRRALRPGSPRLFGYTRVSHTLEPLRAGALAGSPRISLNGAGLTALPPELFEPAIAQTLEILDVSGNALETLPEALATLPRLRIVFASANRFTVLPEVLGRCAQLEMVGFKSNRIEQVSAAALPPRLRWLILTDNALEQLPEALGERPRLQKLALAGNRLRALPQSLAQARQLELLRISANRLEALPEGLLRLPRLAWLACGGNPFSEAREQAALSQTPVPTLPWAALRLHERLGEGASGVIHRVECEGQALALKLFKGEVTSDGWPHSEMAAWLAAGSHPGLIPVTGRLQAHPEGRAGLFMPLIPPSFRALAGPPSLDSCTRDIYPDALRLSPAALQRLAGTVAAALAQLHERGISHGDLYAHNLLHGPGGQAYLGDFGAASLFEPGTAQALALQRLEVRAFGYLLEELLARCEGEPPAAWTALMQACLMETPADRPLFAAIVRALA